MGTGLYISLSKALCCWPTVWIQPIDKFGLLRGTFFKILSHYSKMETFHIKSGFLNSLEKLEVWATLDTHSGMAMTAGHQEGVCSPIHDCPPFSSAHYLNLFTHLYTHLAPPGLWGWKPCSTLYLAGMEYHVWPVSSEFSTGEETTFSFYLFALNHSPPISTCVPLLFLSPYLLPPRSLGRESLFRECKITQTDAHYQALALPSVSGSSVAGAPKVLC